MAQKDTALMKDMTKGERQTHIPRRLDNLHRKGLVHTNHQTREKDWQLSTNTINSICSNVCTSGCYLQINMVE